MSSYHNRQALGDSLSEAISPKFQRSLALFLDVPVFPLPKYTSDFQPLLHFNLQYLVFPLFLLTCLTLELNFYIDLHFFLFLGSSQQTKFDSPNVLLLTYPLFYCKCPPQTLPESQLTTHPLNICGFGLSKRPKGNGSLGIG